MAEIQKIRIDKWLWAVRIYKSRTIAAEACTSGKIKIEGENIKASYLLKAGQTLQIGKPREKLTLRSLKLIEKRVSASLAGECYEDLTPPEEKNKLNFPAIFYEVRDKGIGRPTKKDRREIELFKDKDNESV